MFQGLFQVTKSKINFSQPKKLKYTPPMCTHVDNAVPTKQKKKRNQNTEYKYIASTEQAYHIYLKKKKLRSFSSHPSLSLTSAQVSRFAYRQLCPTNLVPVWSVATVMTTPS